MKKAILILVLCVGCAKKTTVPTAPAIAPVPDYVIHHAQRPLSGAQIPNMCRAGSVLVRVIPGGDAPTPVAGFQVWPIHNSEGVIIHYEICKIQ